MIPDNATPGCGEKWFGCPCVAHIVDNSKGTAKTVHITEYTDGNGYVHHDEWSMA